MPISASQHRISIGKHQSYRNTNSNIVHTLKTKPNCLTRLDEIRHFTSKIASIHNAPEVLNTQSNLHNTPQNVTTIAIQLMLLLSKIKNPDYPILVAHHDLQFMPEKKNFLPAPDYTLPPAIDGYGLNTIWNPVVNAFNEADTFISRHDPLQFPGADAAPLCTNTLLSNDFVNTVHAAGMKVVTQGLKQLKCIDKHKYMFLKVTAHNAIKLLASAIQQLEDKKNNEIDHYLNYYGFIEIDFVKQRLISLYGTIKSEIEDIFKHNRNSVYYGYGDTPETKRFAARVLYNDKERRILLTDIFFGSCTVNAVSILIHEMSHFHSKGDIFQRKKEKSCLNQEKTSEIMLHAQLDDASDFYANSVNNLKIDNIIPNPDLSIVYKIDIEEFLDAFNTNKTLRQEALFINADSISYLVIALGNYGFKKNNIMPLRDTSKFKTEKLIEV